MKHTALYTLLATSMFALAACGGGNEAAAPAPAETPAASTPASAPAPAASAAAPASEVAAPATAKARYFDDATALRQAQESLKALPQFAGKDVMFFQDVNFYDDEGVNRIEISIQDPNKPENIDHYVYKFSEGKWSEPSPVRLSGNGDINANLTNLNDIDFGFVAEKILPALTQKAQEEKLENIKDMPPTFISYIFVPHNQMRFWQTQLETDRARYMVRLNPDGSFKSFERN